MPQRDLIPFAEATLGVTLSAVAELSGGGSSRRYFRLRWATGTAVGVIAKERAELRAFLAFTRHFAARGIPVPQLLGADEARGVYLQSDLGDATLCDRLAQWRAAGRHAAAQGALETALRWLPVIQVRGGAGLDYTLCPEGDELGAAAYRADVELFLTEFVPRHAPHLAPGESVRRDLETLVQRLGALPRPHFCYRDFQTRNIMWPGGGPVFIDYQSGRRGTLAYDVASILFSPDSGLDAPGRERLIDVYLAALADCGEHPGREAFLAGFHALVLLRRLQALGAYARIARVKHSDPYRERIAPALATLHGLLAAGQLRFGLPDLESWLARLCAPHPG
ncbi:MAG: phosphotransferase [Candidatus Lambdaproteobacteria bacterium]|nr:phosphotransferase [Candidatus Lambdaproteobacteria bacterium]